MKVALCFWGLTRSLDYTRESIESCIFQPLRDAGIEYSIFLHTYTLYRPYTNVRAGEVGLQLKNTAWRDLQPTASIVENQDTVDKTLQLTEYRSCGDPWGTPQSDPYGTLNNHIRALWSLKQVTELWTSSTESFDAVIYLRPDMLYRRKLNIEWIRNLEDTTLYMPNFHLIEGCNDRFAIGKPSVMRIYGGRFTGALEFSRRLPLHSEKYLAFKLSLHNIHCNYINFPFRRVRANGKIHEDDMLL
jgi:hypothetical protein